MRLDPRVPASLLRESWPSVHVWDSSWLGYEVLELGSASGGAGRTPGAVPVVRGPAGTRRSVAVRLCGIRQRRSPLASETASSWRRSQDTLFLLVVKAVHLRGLIVSLIR